MHLPISERVPRAALVTGGAKRIGRVIALALADAGFAVGVHYNTSRADADRTVSEIRLRGVNAVALGADLADEQQVESLLPEARQALGPIGVLVNNASTFVRDEWDDATRASWDLHMEPNLRAPFRLMQCFAELLAANDRGSIVNMCDQRVVSLTPHFVSYTLSKAGLWALTQTMALALAPRIRVNAIGPGPTVASARQTQEQFRRQCASVPLGHGATPDEIGQAVVILTALTSITGQLLTLDGGQHLHWSTGSGAAPVEE